MANEAFSVDRYRKQAEPARLEPVAGRVPPSDLDAEAAVLSATLLEAEAFDAVQEILLPEHFYADANRRIYEAIVDLHIASRPVDIVSVAGFLRDKGRLDQIGGTPYLAELANATPAVAHVAAHAQVIREKWRLRQLIATCQKFAAEGYGDCGGVQEFIDQAEQSVFDIARIPETSTVVAVRDAIKGAFEVLGEAARRGGGITGIESGFTDLDRQTAGLHEGDLYIVAARPGMGKTSFVLNMAVNVARPKKVKINAENEAYFDAAVEEPGHGVLFCSLEMPREQLAARLLASEARVDMSRIRSGKLQRDDWNKLTDAASRLGRLPIWLDDTPALTLLDLRAKIRRLQAELKRGEAGKNAKGLGLVAIDYLQLMQGRRDAGSREQEISELSRGLKRLAKEMKIPVLALSQLNRQVETRTTKDKRPQLSDLRESGAIEQDADTIMFIYRDEYYNDQSDQKGIAELIIAKQRNGPTGKIMTKFTSEYTRFDNLAPEEYTFNEFDDFSGDEH
ncbi:MAG TPA: replicative DNA helicase [Polyangiaceae bacterium]|jgi:replicative DNA helicase